MVPFKFSLETFLYKSPMGITGPLDFIKATIRILFTFPKFMSASEKILNILLFIPFGFIFLYGPKLNQKTSIRKIALVVLSGFSLSILIELFQLFFPRNPSILDLLTNSIGTIIGAIIALSYGAETINFIQSRWFQIQGKKALLWSIVILYCSIFFALSNLPILHSDFRNWDTSYPLQLGNEATHDRPWLGTIYSMAIYNRPLNQDEIRTRFNKGFSSYVPENQKREGLVAWYPLDEGSGILVHDESGNGNPLNLTIEEPSKIKWLTPNGLEFLSPTIVKSQGPADELVHSLSATSELTIETWISPKDLKQEGPARIVSLAPDTAQGNVTLGQSRRNVDFRLRTPVSGRNGTKVQLVTNSEPLTKKTQHLVATYSKGLEKLYINGIQREVSLLDGTNNFFQNYILVKNYTHTGVGLGGKWAYCFAFFFPMVFLLNTIFFRTNYGPDRSILFSSSIAYCVLLCIEIVTAINAPRPFDIALLSCGILTILMSSTLSSILNRANLGSSKR